MLPDFGGEIGVEFFLRIRRRNFGNAEAGEETEERQRDEDDAGKPLLAMKMLRHQRGGDGAENDGHEGAEFENAVAPGELPFRQ